MVPGRQGLNRRSKVQELGLFAGWLKGLEVEGRSGLLDSRVTSNLGFRVWEVMGLTA